MHVIKMQTELSLAFLKTAGRLRALGRIASPLQSVEKTRSSRTVVGALCLSAYLIANVQLTAARTAAADEVSIQQSRDVVAVHASAQDDSSVAPSFRSGDPIAKGQRQIDALNSMSHAMGPMIRDAKTRIAQMTEYISTKGLSREWSTYTPADSSAGFDGLTFDQGLEAAVQHQKLRALSNPATDDPAVMQREVSATQTLIKAQWTHLNDLHNQVAKLSAFLTNKGQLEAYRDWAVADAASKIEARAAAREEHNAATAEHASALRVKLDQQWHAQQAAENAADRARGGGDDQVGVRDDNPGGGGDSYDDDDYYGGSYWNGYADPYYDVWGHRRLRARQEVREGIQEHHDWHRSAGGSPHPAPSVVHPSRHMRRRR